MKCPQTMHSDWAIDEVTLDLYTPLSHNDLPLHCVLSVPATLQPFPHSAHIHSQPLSSSCAFQGLKRGFGGVQAVGQCVFFDTQVSGAHWTCAATSKSTTGKGEDCGFLFSCVSACRNSTPAKLLGSTMSAGVIQLSTGLLLGIIPALFNSVVRTTIECCFISVISQTLSSLTASEMSLWKFFESVLGIYPASAGEVHERAQLPLSNLHSDTHQQACMAPIDRLMMAAGGDQRLCGCLEIRPTLTQRTRSQAHSHSNILCDKHYKGDL